MSKRIATHNGHYHSDDIFAVATLCIYLEGEDVEILRTRDASLIESADFVVDIGGGHDPERCIFDHHQEGGAGKRPNGIPYASFGLVWKRYGSELSGGDEEAELVDRKLVQPIDAEDNGVEVSKEVFDNVDPYTIQDFFYAFIPTWREDDIDVDTVFKNCVDIAKRLLKREIGKAKDKKDAERLIREELGSSVEEKVIVLDRYLPWKDVVTEYPDPLFVVYPATNGESWHVQAVPLEKGTLATRLPFPDSWAGKRDEELVEATGVEDAVFCHNGRFLAVASSKEGALELAQRVIEGVSQ